MHFSTEQLDDVIRRVYLNCEDFKKHSFPNVLIQILDALFGELEKHLTGWFGKKKMSRDLIRNIRRQLLDLQKRADEREQDIRELEAAERSSALTARTAVASGAVVLDASKAGSQAYRAQIDAATSTETKKFAS